LRFKPARMRPCFLPLLLFPFATFAQPIYADLVLQNGGIYTLQSPGHKVKALAIQGERIVYTGSKRGAKKWVGPTTQVRNLKGKT
jgi:predicted amidohydrolase YtcJ